MPRRTCTSLQETVRLMDALKRLRAPVHVQGRCVSCPDLKLWQKANKMLAGQDVIRKAAESKSMMEDLL